MKIPGFIIFIKILSFITLDRQTAVRWLNQRGCEDSQFHKNLVRAIIVSVSIFFFYHGREIRHSLLTPSGVA